MGEIPLYGHVHAVTIFRLPMDVISEKHLIRFLRSFRF
jgi:hypothetical protein